MSRCKYYSKTTSNSAPGTEKTKNKMAKLNKRPDHLTQPGHGKISETR